jgi:hypothetical protein
MILVAVMGFYGIIAYASGSRGLVLYPVLLLVCGAYFFVDRPRFRPERWAPILAVCFVVYIYAVEVFRNTEQFQNSRISDLGARLAATKEIGRVSAERRDFALATGSALIAVSDEIVYDMTPRVVPFAGGADILPALPWTWVPHALAPHKPLIWDANEVVAGYTSVRNERSYASISLTADLYRRFGWLGVAPGQFLFGLMYGAFIRWILYYFSRISVVGGVTLIAFVTAGLQAPFASTVLQTWWIWAYDLPKHLLPLVCITWLLGRGTDRGLDAYWANKRHMAAI